MTTDKYLYWNPNDPDHHNSVVTIKAAAYNVEMVEIALVDYPFAFYTFRSQLIPIDRLGKDYWDGYTAAIKDLERWSETQAREEILPKVTGEALKRLGYREAAEYMGELRMLMKLSYWTESVRKKFKL
jgi:hypothetical protein